VGYPGLFFDVAVSNWQMRAKHGLRSIRHLSNDVFTHELSVEIVGSPSIGDHFSPITSMLIRRHFDGCEFRAVFARMKLS
jgi:hypothetical protein